jgi:hypothetical protein
MISGSWAFRGYVSAVGVAFVFVLMWLCVCGLLYWRVLAKSLCNKFVGSSVAQVMISCPDQYHKNIDGPLTWW